MSVPAYLMRTERRANRVASSSVLTRIILTLFYCSFMSTLLPPTPETLQHVLTQGGLPAWLAAAHDPKFDAFLTETRATTRMLDGSGPTQRSAHIRDCSRSRLPK